MNNTYTNQGYILGNACEYEPYTHVLTFDRFLESLMLGNLPPYQSWIVGQGVTPEERSLLRRLQQASLKIHFVMPMIDDWHNPQTRTILNHFRLIEPYHYQAEAYFSPFYSPKSNTDNMTPKWTVEGSGPLNKYTNRLSSDSACLVEAIEALAVEGLKSTYSKGFIAIKDLKLHQVRKLFPLSVTLDAQLFRAAHSNSYARYFSGKVYFYQDEFCLAQASFHAEVETEENVLAKDNLTASRVFGQ